MPTGTVRSSANWESAHKAVSQETPYKPWKHARPAFIRLATYCKVKQGLAGGVADDGRRGTRLLLPRRCIPIRPRIITAQLAGRAIAFSVSCAFSRPQAG